MVQRKLTIPEKLTNSIQNVKNIDELRTAILQEWQQFPQERRRRLVRSMTRRTQNFTINVVDIFIIDFYALHIRTIDAFKSS